MVFSIRILEYIGTSPWRAGGTISARITFVVIGGVVGVVVVRQ